MKKAIPLLAALCVPTFSQASLLVYESFNYGSSTSDGATLNAKATSATGLGGNYGVTTVGSGSATFNASGLSFSNFVTTGGAARLNSGATGSSNAVLSASLNLSASATGTLYSSYLVQFTSFSTTPNGGGNQVRLKNTGNNTNLFQSSAKAATAIVTPGVAYGNNTPVNAPQPGGGANITTGVTYLVVNTFTNVGSALSVGSPGVATTALFDLASYNNWVEKGSNENGEFGLTALALRTVSDTVTSGTFTFSNASKSLQLTTFSGSGSGQNAIFDELRFGTALSDVVGATIPEPSTYALLAGSLTLAGVVALRRRNQTTPSQ
jgi:hypothetical protein